ncbi:hypothetical protein IAI18_07140 [Acetobacteraceae bacterium H6797]|nr:hypothetical protein [Acetobacteraceae bacterium H6797]
MELTPLPASLPLRLALPCLALLTSACSRPVTPEPALANPPFSAEKGVVYLFPGVNFPSTDVSVTGMTRLAERLRAQGVTAALYSPANWSAAADAALAQPQGTPIAVAGYALGGEAASQFADKLRGAGLPVQTLVSIEGFTAEPLPCNVRAAVDIFSRDGRWNLATRLEPGKGYSGDLQRIDWLARQDQKNAGPWVYTMDPNAFGLAEKALLQQGRVREQLPSVFERRCHIG